MKENYESAEENQEAEAAEVKTSEKPKSGVLENRSLEVGKTEVQRSGKPTLIILILTRII